MQQLEGKFAGRKFGTDELVRVLEPIGFAVSGNWNYEGGSFDCALNEERTLWLRLPFTAVNGPFDGEANESVFVQMKRPFVLKHEYRVGNDPDAGVQLFGAVVNQFQAPSNPDASLSPAELHRARAKLDEAENVLGRMS